MAQDYLKLYLDSSETHYASGVTPLMSLAQLNEGVKFIAVPIEGSETENGGDQFIVQRTKRIKAEASVQDATKGMGDNVLARLNKAKRLTWDSIATKAVNKQDFIVRMSKDQNMDVLEGTPYEKAIADGIKNTAIAAEEVATAKVFAAGTKAASPLVVDGTKDAETVKAIQDAVSEVQLFVDDFKAYSNGVVVLVHPTVAKVFSRVQGQSYQTGTNTFPEGLGSHFRYDGIDFFVSPILNTIEGAAATEVAGAIVMDKEAYANAGYQKLMKEFDQVYLDERVVGHSYGELDLVVDSARIKVFEMTLPTGLTKSKKVNA